jgi:hypothetical protein
MQIKPILSQLNPTDIFTQLSFKILFNIIFSSTFVVLPPLLFWLGFPAKIVAV